MYQRWNLCHFDIIFSGTAGIWYIILTIVWTIVRLKQDTCHAENRNFVFELLTFLVPKICMKRENICGNNWIDVYTWQIAKCGNKSSRQ